MFSLPARLTSHMLRTTAVAVGLVGTLLTAAAPVHAQGTPAQPTATLRFDEGGALAFTSPYGQTDVGRLRATFLSLPGQPEANLAANLFCVDLLHNVTFVPEGWRVYLTNLGGAPSLDYTRQGARYADAAPDALTRYRKAAWLVDQYAKVRTLTDTAGIQAAMWMQFEPTLAPYTFADAGEQLSTTSWLAAADTFASSQRFETYNWSRFTVVTDVNAAGMGDDYHGFQELITKTPLTTTTPEPATVVLLGGGLVAAGLVTRRKRQS